MGVATTASAKLGQLRELVGAIQRQEGFDQVVASLQGGHAATLDGVWGSACALVVAALQAYAPGPILVLTAQPEETDDFLEDLELFLPPDQARREQFPALESLPEEARAADECFGQRLRVLQQLRRGSYGQLIVGPIQALMQPVPTPAQLQAHSRRLQVGMPLQMEQLVGWLQAEGFQRMTAVALPGEFSVRGGLVDLFAPDATEPLRVEFFGDQIESIRQFEVASQRSVRALEEVEITGLGIVEAQHGCLTEYLPETAWVVLVEPGELERCGHQYLQRLEKPEKVHTYIEVLQRLVRFPSVTVSAVAASSWETTCRLRIESVERFTGDIHRVQKELDSIGADQQVYLICETDAEIRRLQELFQESALMQQGRLQFVLGKLHRGFRLVSERTVLVSSGELFRREEIRRPVARHLGRAIDSFLELQEGELVVHVAHGIARYRGLQLLEKDQQLEEHLVLEFAEGTKLYVPTSKIGLVQKYVGGTKARPRLAKLGGRLWARQKKVVENAVTDLAAEMLQMQAKRCSLPGIRFPPDTQWQHEFDASFPYPETPDQLAAIQAVKQDMESSRPMDRLLCGDVGFGKTEVAMRAAFKAVCAGYQVAMLVPTTILAEQHLRTFTSRMAEFPIRIAVLSRFVPRRHQQQILEDLASGRIDIIIGTHRLVQPDVRFHNLGLVIIDEEQRFGVELKERFKRFREMADVLTMTATPIPRTLHMALVGLRDISNLQTPPADRLAVETHVCRFDPELIRHAVLRELNRNGQIFFVHNRVADIQEMAAVLEQIVPEARLRIGHAQMPEEQLERVMLDFIDHRFDILLCTTIIESGLDLPNVNTIFINEADRYGLADLHQLRGRVGRYKHRAYCYLLIDPERYISPNAARRLRAIEEYSQLGAGFAIAMRDLEIRGAGNILGREQSGHIAMVGYELYCQLLEQAIARLKRQPIKTPLEVDIDLPGAAYLPRTYVPDVRLKMDLYRRLARAETYQDLQILQAEIQDRFGPLPPEVQRLLLVHEIRIAAGRWYLSAIRMERHQLDTSYVVFVYRVASFIRQLAKLSGGRLRIVDNQTAYLPLPKEVTTPDQILHLVKMLLQSEEKLPYNPAGWANKEGPKSVCGSK
ncbi:MAG: transcription-repair coupling factor [Thermoguttaceae bacterium]|nr:transcription-repair coupling factor [Thermoguttaceae bacterium]MDW8036904.1 transcription-repair coupling factor [Thermoguttaceae bacterium]